MSHSILAILMLVVLAFIIGVLGLGLYFSSDKIIDISIETLKISIATVLGAFAAMMTKSDQ
jgi:hypothetical protein